MFLRIKQISTAMWAWFLARSLFMKLLLIVPIICAVSLTLLVGNMGLAMMGTAYAINAMLVGYVGGFIGLFAFKGVIGTAKDRKTKD